MRGRSRTIEARRSPCIAAQKELGEACRDRRRDLAFCARRVLADCQRMKATLIPRIVALGLAPE
jgi:hypothetical protein